MNYSYPQIYLQEIPGEISLGLSISGCNVFCKGCHSKETWDPNFGSELNTVELDRLIAKNKHISCVLFFGGEWNNNIVDLLKFTRSKGLKTALYSGLNNMLPELIEYLDYYKVGPYMEELGGLSSKVTNQRLFKLSAINITNILTKG